jgi:hypothetical protein
MDYLLACTFGSSSDISSVAEKEKASIIKCTLTSEWISIESGSKRMSESF